MTRSERIRREARTQAAVATIAAIGLMLASVAIGYWLGRVL